GPRHRGEDARARVRGVLVAGRRAEEPGAHAVHAHEQQAAEKLEEDTTMGTSNEVVIVSAVRSAVGRAAKGALAQTRPDELAGQVIKAALAKVPALDPKEVDDVILGCAMPEGEQGLNVARVAALLAGLPIETSAATINRFCSSGLQAIAQAAERI